MKKTITYNEVKKTCLDVINGGGGGGGTSTGLKTFTFEGDGNLYASNTVELPSDCHLIVGIHAHGSIEETIYDISTGVLFIDNGVMKVLVTAYVNGDFEDGFEINCLHSVANNELTFDSIDDGNPFSYPFTYTVFYM